MSKSTNVNNSSARVWTKAELKETAKQSKANGFKVIKDRDFEGQVLIFDQYADTYIVVAMPGYAIGIHDNKKMVCRIDTSYFEN